MKSIVILVPYFGVWPFWFDLFLASCARNPTINWLFFTDCGVPAGAPANVAFRQLAFADYKRCVSAFLGIDFDPADPYKLCDLRPAFGFLHRREIERFDFWGFGDIDVIYGDLRAYFHEQRLANHQLLSCHARRISGHLTLIANTEVMRDAFRAVPDWRELMAGRHVAFDERRFSRVFLRHRSWPKWLRDWVYRNDPHMRNVEFNETYSTGPCNVPWIDGTLNYPQAWYWRGGKLTNDLTGAREFPYFHFVQWKQLDWRGVDHRQLLRVGPRDIEQGFSISAGGFRPLAPSSPKRMMTPAAVAAN